MQYDDSDYINKLPVKTRKWMLKFLKEYYYNTDTNSEDAIHNTEDLRKKCSYLNYHTKADIMYAFSRTDLQKSYL